MREVTFDDLVDAYFSAAKWANAAPELRDYHAMKRDLLQELFGCTLAQPKAQHDVESLARIARVSLEQSTALSSPFGVYLEGRPGPMETVLRDEYKRTFDACSNALTSQYRMIFRHALGALFPKATTRTFSWATLFERGLATQVPDPDDFW